MAKPRNRTRNIQYTSEISVVIPCLSEHERVEKCLRRLLKQTVKAEIVIVEYNPKHETYTRDVARKYKCKYFEVPRAGIAFARHYGIMRSSGSVICNLDADAWFENPVGLARMTWPILNKYCILTVCDNVFDLIDLPDDELAKMELPNKVIRLLSEAQSLSPIAILEPGSCLDKEAYIKVGGFDDIKQYELFTLNNRLMYNYGVLHKHWVSNVRIHVSPRRALKFSEQGLAVLDYANAYR